MSLGADQRAEVAAVLFGDGGQSETARILIRHADALHAGQFERRQLVHRTLHGTGGHVVLHRIGQTREQKLIPAALQPGQHGRLLPLGRSAEAGEQLHLGGRKTHGLRGNQDIRAFAHALVAGLDHQFVEGTGALRRTHPQQIGAVTNKARTALNQPEQETGAHDGDRRKGGQARRRNQRGGTGVLRHGQRVGRHEFEERVVLLAPLDEGEQAFAELRELRFGLGGGAPPVDAQEGNDDAEGEGEGEGNEQQEPGGPHDRIREGKRIGHEHERKGSAEGDGGRHGGAARPGR